MAAIQQSHGLSTLQRIRRVNPPADSPATYPILAFSLISLQEMTLS